MRSMMLRSTPVFGDLMREILEPYKYGPRMYENDIGTEEDPSIIVRSEVVQKKYKAWRNPDGSYHEVLIEEGEDLPTKPEITA
jgi:hypothetical protein